jgi:hypothetical protein
MVDHGLSGHVYYFILKILFYFHVAAKDIRKLRGTYCSSRAIVQRYRG